ncbi:uncharacterized protein KY384_002814 [Bacidia gigantensis]|uniref:uncharacterized protein n=1 Tax=Bacidia gigantensis TaxID=2732470 RepID=UPI001D0584EC|nr:uncharacterized protein KY384_002814 [Bacidia gigantensis]KAG8532936.1 hypothetical protein KY384_002814 [Bacidia gigantensis]
MERSSLEDGVGYAKFKMDEAREMKEVQMRPLRRSSQVLTKPAPIHAENLSKSLPTRRRSLDGSPNNRQSSSRDVEVSRQRIDAMTVEERIDDYHDLKEKYSELKREYKLANRDVREQSLELRDIKRQNASLMEAYSAIQKELQAVSSGKGKLTNTERSKYMEHFQMLEEQAAYFQQEYRKRDAHLSYLTKQTRDANGEKEAAEEESRKLQRKIRDLSASLTECRDDLLRLQPPPQASDSEVAEMYSNLVGQISGWVDEKTEDPEKLEAWFDNLKTPSEIPQDFRNDLPQRLYKIAKQHPECLPSLMQHLIHSKILVEILSPKVFVYGLDENNTLLLQGIEEGMSELEPKRDALTLRRHRSETLRGLIKMSAFATEQTHQSHLLATTLSTALSTILSPTHPIDPSDLHARLLAPTVKLSNTLRTSTTDYNLFSHAFARSPNAAYSVHRNEIQHYGMVDNATSKPIKMDSNLSVREDGRIGEELFVVSPGMVRGGAGGRETPQVLVKPVLLVSLDEPMGRKSRVPKGLGGWTSSWFGGGGGGEGGVVVEEVEEEEGVRKMRGIERGRGTGTGTGVRSQKVRREEREVRLRDPQEIVALESC